jgi:hypothetical protein
MPKRTIARGSAADLAFNRWCWRRTRNKLERKMGGRLLPNWRETKAGYRAFQSCKRELVKMSDDDRAGILYAMMTEPKR